MEHSSLPTVHVEIAKKITSHLKRQQVLDKVKSAIENDRDLNNQEFNFPDFLSKNPELQEVVSSIRTYFDTKGTNDHLPSSPSNLTKNSPTKLSNGHTKKPKVLKYYVYDLNEDGEEAEYMDDDDENDQSASSHHWILPSASFDGLWDSLIFSDDIKTRLMKYINTALLFSEKGVDNNLISWNKVILLHGPPGTGKTSLCKALAQKAAIRLSDRYLYGQLIEINSHSLFSKWFSESGKLVMKMFEKIHDLVEDSQSLVFLMIDEVESLAQCRQSAEAGNEPTDSIRAVNALLTQIDRIKRYPNVVILTTSNIVGSIDLAFVDRADLKIYIGHPPTEIIYGILATSLNELLRVGIISNENNPGYQFPRSFVEENEEINMNFTHRLYDISRLAIGMSGRTLRKLPFLAHANFVQSSCNLDTFLPALKQAIEMETKEANALKRKIPS